jgi:hypothetical protein
MSYDPNNHTIGFNVQRKLTQAFGKGIYIVHTEKTPNGSYARIQDHLGRTASLKAAIRVLGGSYIVKLNETAGPVPFLVAS